MIKINLLGDTLAQVGGKKAEKAEAVPVYADSAATGRPSLPIAGVLFGLVIASAGGIYYVMLNSQIEREQRTKVELEAKKKELEKYMDLERKFRSQKEMLQKKKEVMMGLKSFQHLPVHFLEELANALPDDVWFREINQKGLTISIKGESSSFEAVNQFRNRLVEQTKWFQNVNYPAANKNGRTVEFTISCDLKNSA
ncbi:PilN domain-containing protein [Geothrix sp. 21YS21S-2]|uniref:PilN domain-containing protein n=1 Tax=Geothrix sp. 21YS21S-2 TaxID=3068893 RepID=UPI0027BA2144|nr:PilN domain-containing protein [Geothrix sp. 21YS21S-2]